MREEEDSDRERKMLDEENEQTSEYIKFKRNVVSLFLNIEITVILSKTSTCFVNHF